MADRKLFTVFGATGQQGGALIRYILAHPRFSNIYKLRGITRDVNKPSAKALLDEGIEVVEVRPVDVARLWLETPITAATPSLTQQLGKYERSGLTPSLNKGVLHHLRNDKLYVKPASAKNHSLSLFSHAHQLTDWDSASRTTETQQGRNLADAAISSGAHALIWSSLPRIGLPNFESKADVEDYIRTLPIKAVFYMPGWFMQNQLSFFRPVRVDQQGNGKKEEKGEYVLKQLFPGCVADTLVPLVDNDDIGKFVQPFLDDLDRLSGKRLTASSGFWTPRDMCEIWRKNTGKQVWYEGDAHSEEEDGDRTDGSGDDSLYYGNGSRHALSWTIGQMEEQPNSWESFVKKVEEKEGWFR